MPSLEYVPPPQAERPGRAHLCTPALGKPPHPTVVDALEAGARARLPWLTFHRADGTDTLDFAAALAGARRVGRVLGAHGVGRGDRVPILLPTGSAFVEALLGCMCIGAVPVPLASPMTFGGAGRYLAQLATVVRDADARLVVTTARMRDEIARSPLRNDGLDRVLTEPELLDPPAGDLRWPSIDAGDLALLQYTSGTLGQPKGVMISHRALVANAHAIAQGLQLTANDVGVSWLPMFHDMGLIGVLFTSLCHPYPVHLLRPEAFVMQPARWLSLVAEVGGTLTAAPNFAYELALSRPHRLQPGGLASLRTMLNGAEVVHASTVRRFDAAHRDLGLRSDSIAPVYGLAEATLAVSFPRGDARFATCQLNRARLESHGVVVGEQVDHEVVAVGAPLAGFEVRIVADGQVARAGQVGEVQVAGPSLMDGYFRNAADSEQALSDGYLRTGDLGFVADGQLFITGRLKDLIIKGGRNVYPYDVERVTHAVSGVRGSVAAFSVANPATGTDDLVVVAETMKRDPEERSALERAIRGEVLAELGFKVDTVALWPVGRVPRTTSGKVQRGACREQFLSPERVTGPATAQATAKRAVQP